MAVVVEVEKNQNENSLSLIRRFSRRVRGAGILNRVRGLRYYQRPASRSVQRKHALKRIEKRAERFKQIKLGKISETPVHTRRQ
jgi:ribosomal protein S21